MVERRIVDDMEALLDKLPPRIEESVRSRENVDELLEVVLDLGRQAEARVPNESVSLGANEVTYEDLRHVIDRVGNFGEDNRAGVERTLHRISAIRNRRGDVVGLTLRFGRAVYGTIRIIEDLIFSGKSVLLLGKPGVGKTTMLREVARVLADDAGKRVIVVDTSNEIAGDGDIPHPGIGRARRMQVPKPALQHDVMIEAVENHMPEVIIIDEIGTELEANAARTIAERGVQLVATAHGNTLDNLVMNPTLSDLIEARRRRTQKTVLERRAPPTFDVLVEIQGWNVVTVHPDVTDVVDRMLRGFAVSPEMRESDGEGGFRVKRSEQPTARTDLRGVETPRRREPPFPAARDLELAEVEPPKTTHILPYGVNRGRLQHVVRSANAPIELVMDISHADLLVTTKNYYRRKTKALRDAEEVGKPVYVLRKNTTAQLEQFIQAITRRQGHAPVSVEHVDGAVQEAEDAAIRVRKGEGHVELNPQGAYVRRLQHEIAGKFGLASSSMGKEPGRHVVIFRR